MSEIRIVGPGKKTRISLSGMQKYKFLSWVYGVDRRVTDRHHEAYRVMLNSDPE